VVWLSDGARGLWRLYEVQLAAVAVGIRDFYHAVQYLWKGRRLGGTAAPPGRVGGLAGPGTGCGMASRTGSWPTWSRPWRSRACLTPRGIR
jgi:hypothetical protein